MTNVPWKPVVIALLQVISLLNTLTIGHSPANNNVSEPIQTPRREATWQDTWQWTCHDPRGWLKPEENGRKNTLAGYVKYWAQHKFVYSTIVSAK